MSQREDKFKQDRRPLLRGWPGLVARLLLLFLGLLLLGRINVPVFVVAPGVVASAGDMVKINAPDLPPAGRHQGEFLVTTLAARPGTVGSVFLASMSPRQGLVSAHDLLGPDQTLDDYLAQSEESMRQSQVQATVAALKYLGYSAAAQGTGIQVMHVLDHLDADTSLQPGDVIVTAQGVEVSLVEELLALVQPLAPGSRIEFEVERQGRTLAAQAQLTDNPQTAASGGLPVQLLTRDLVLILPPEIEVDIDAGEISGPSAGLMFALEIINRFSDVDLTGGRTVAGTGTITASGAIGPVGGIPFKQRAAVQAGAQAFIQPQPPAGLPAADYGDLHQITGTNLAQVVEALTSFSQ